MRKILFIFTICLVYSFSNICLAHWLPKSELFVGGVGPGCTLEYVASVYGQPKEKRWFNSDGVRGVTYIYSPYFSILLCIAIFPPSKIIAALSRISPYSNAP